jgi:hypothetical protein
MKVKNIDERMSYDDFLKNKKKSVNETGFNIDNSKLNPMLFDFQRHIVKKALKSGKYAIFADCGLGKTFMQLEWANQVSIYNDKPVLILVPLAVSGQTIEQGVNFGIKVNKILPNTEIGNGIYITNYEQIENIDTSLFCGVVLDESSILKNFEGKTKELIISRFADTQYKLACTATPSPNDPMELGNHTEFLNVMSRVEMLAMYFVHDGGETAKWRIKGHCQSAFWEFVSTWSVMLSKPSDIGFGAKGYDLPDLNLIEKQVKRGKEIMEVYLTMWQFQQLNLMGN